MMQAAAENSIGSMLSFCGSPMTNLPVKDVFLKVYEGDSAAVLDEVGVVRTRGRAA